MIKNANCHTKSVSIEESDDYRKLTDLSNPYSYNFGTSRTHLHTSDFQKLHNKVNFDYFNKS